MLLRTEVQKHCDWLERYSRLPDKLWRRLEPLLPKYPPSPKGGRLRTKPRGVMDGIWYVLRTGCQWKELPRYYGAPSTVHRLLSGVGPARRLRAAVEAVFARV